MTFDQAIEKCKIAISCLDEQDQAEYLNVLHTFGVNTYYPQTPQYSFLDYHVAEAAHNNAYQQSVISAQLTAPYALGKKITDRLIANIFQRDRPEYKRLYDKLVEQIQTLGTEERKKYEDMLSPLILKNYFLTDDLLKKKKESPYADAYKIFDDCDLLVEQKKDLRRICSAILELTNSIERNDTRTPKERSREMEQQQYEREQQARAQVAYQQQLADQRAKESKKALELQQKREAQQKIDTEKLKAEMSKHHEQQKKQIPHDLIAICKAAAAEFLNANKKPQRSDSFFNVKNMYYEYLDTDGADEIKRAEEMISALAQFSIRDYVPLGFFDTAYYKHPFNPLSLNTFLIKHYHNKFPYELNGYNYETRFSTYLGRVELLEVINDMIFQKKHKGYISTYPHVTPAPLSDPLFPNAERKMSFFWSSVKMEAEDTMRKFGFN